MHSYMQFLNTRTLALSLCCCCLRSLASGFSHRLHIRLVSGCSPLWILATTSESTDGTSRRHVYRRPSSASATRVKWMRMIATRRLRKMKNTRMVKRVKKYGAHCGW